jgi:23S rRNA (cytosine1962-C5)-methyltransferase
MPDGNLSPAALSTRLAQAWQTRAATLDESHTSAQRLFNGFLEGCPELVVDLYGRTLLLYHFPAGPPQANVQEALDFYLPRLPWRQAAVLKRRRGKTPAERNGVLVWGQAPDSQVQEAGVWYALDLLLNQDASFYPDTRLLRAWLQENAPGKRVLNTFAYTGSLGVAARVAGASQVVQIDRSARFLALAKRSLSLNGLRPQPGELQVGDFFVMTSRLRRAGALFDIVIIDPPFFSASTQGRVDLSARNVALLNKVRPLVADGGRLVAVNNALFVSGQEYWAALQSLCADGYISIETIITIPPDFTGSPATRRGSLPADPAPFNHATKIAVLSIRRKLPTTGEAE